MWKGVLEVCVCSSSVQKPFGASYTATAVAGRQTTGMKNSTKKKNNGVACKVRRRSLGTQKG